MTSTDEHPTTSVTVFIGRLFASPLSTTAATCDKVVVAFGAGETGICERVVEALRTSELIPVSPAPELSLFAEEVATTELVATTFVDTVDCPEMISAVPPDEPVKTAVTGFENEDKIDVHVRPSAAGIAYAVAQMRVFKSSEDTSTPPSICCKE